MNGAMFLPEFDMETSNTRRMLAAIPEDRLDFKPHPKSLSLGELATHVANLPALMPLILEADELDVAGGFDQPKPGTGAEILAHFDKTVGHGRALLESASAEQMGEDWTLRNGDQVHFTMPKGAVLRAFVFNHVIHHRGQLAIYLRLLEAPVPGMYGPSADEKM
jgi:uncharacterized damage-inducible protein DinB